MNRVKKSAPSGGSSARSSSGNQHSSGESNDANVPRPKILRKRRTRAAVREWLARGIYCVPIESRGKKPVGGDNWNKLKITDETVERYFSDRHNLGGLWGEPSAWIVDIDLDCEEACWAARILLPETFAYGRDSAPASHYLYRSVGIAGRKFATKEEGVIVEIRSTGSQSVLPPSIHPSGEPYKIYHDVEFTTVNRAKLEQQVRHVAAAALLAKYYPDENGRHDYVHCVTGALMSKNWPAEEVSRFMNAVLMAAAGKEDDAEQRKRTVANTIRHYRAGDHVAGWPTLSQHMPGKELAYLKTWLDLKTSEIPDIVPVEEEIKELKPKPFLLDVPGLVGDIAHWSSRTSFTQQPLFDVAVGLAAVSFCSRNRYLLGYWDTPLQPYFLLLAPTAAGKDSARASIFECVRRAGLPDVVFQGFQSHHAMLDLLAQRHMALWLWDETGRKLQSASKNSGDFQILTYLMELYGKAAQSVPGMPGRKQAVPPIEHPFFHIFAASQPTALMDALTDSDVNTGLINRFMLVDAGDKAPEANTNRDNTFPATIEKRVKEFPLLKSHGKEFISIDYDTYDTAESFSDFAAYARDKAAEGGVHDLWGRANQNALMCAGAVAVGCNPKRPVITAAVSRWAIAWVSWCTERWVYRVEQSASRSIVERGSKLVERIVWGIRNYKHRALGRRHELELVERGLTPRSLLVRLARHLRGKDLDDVITSLVTADLIGVGEIDGATCYWPITAAARAHRE